MYYVLKQCLSGLELIRAHLGVLYCSPCTTELMHWAIPENTNPPPPPWTTLNWVPKNFRISKKDSSSLCRIPNPADSKSWRIPEICKILNGFAGIPVKTHKILRGNSWNSSQAHRAFITGFPMSSIGGGGWIFSGIAHHGVVA